MAPSKVDTILIKRAKSGVDIEIDGFGIVMAKLDINIMVLSVHMRELRMYI